MDVSRFVNLIYVGILILTFVILDKTLVWIWASFEALQHYAIIGSLVTLTTLIAAVAAVVFVLYLYRKKEAYSFLSEVVIELKKVTWPSWEETKRSTLIVIIFAFVLSGFIWASDQVWRVVTDYILTPGA